MLEDLQPTSNADRHGFNDADLARCIQPVPDGLAVDFFRASSYGAGTQSDGKVLVNLECMRTDIAGRHVLVVCFPAQFCCNTDTARPL